MQDRISYQQLQPEDRITIASMRQQDCSVRAMARTLQRSASTISRELGRNTVGDQAYGSHLAQQACMAPERHPNSPTYRQVNSPTPAVRL